MAQAIDSYGDGVSLGDECGLLNLTWTLDEREFLEPDLRTVLSRELEDELRSGIEWARRYPVQDPYGEQLLLPAIRDFFRLPEWSGSLTCGAGVISLLHAIARMAADAPAYVVGDTYPDFPHWVEQLGGACVGGPPGNVPSARGAARPSLVFLERPPLIGDRWNDLDEVRSLCEGVADARIPIVIDESNASYWPTSYSAVPLVDEVDNLAVIRGFSKAYGVGGLRLSYCAASAALGERLKAVTPPLLASSLSLRLGLAILRQGEMTAPLRDRIRTAKPLLLAFLEAAGFDRIVLSSEHLPYVFLAGDPESLRARLAVHGVAGKPHRRWSAQDPHAAPLYRLSAPLREERLELLRQRMAAIS
jgi:histidinol-phosphate/aromatic aminotransferase/cobyric acid decarboxylase-like protein